MKSKFNEAKATQLAAMVLKRSGGHRDVLDFTKILYCLERESLLKFHRLLTGDSYVSMKHGLVLSSVYNLSKEGRHYPLGVWDTYIERVPDSYRINLKSDPGTDEFSVAELEFITGIIDHYVGMSTTQLVDEIHHKKLPEWILPPEGTKRVWIEQEQVLEKEGVPSNHIDRVAHRAEVGSIFESAV